MTNTTTGSSKEAPLSNKQTEIPSWYYDPYDPDVLTYLEDEEIQTHYKIKIPRNIWILKPGENSNQGCGINVSNSMNEISQLVRNTQNASRTLIIQKYIDRPLLFAGRKFDIRIFCVIASINSKIKGYLYTDGYLRTSCKEFSLDNLGARYVHLTNDAI
jgi:tubulin---tyrosine ligase